MNEMAFGGRDRSFGNSMTPPVKEGDELDVTIEAVGAKGDGVAKVDGFVLFVPSTKTGEKVHVQVTRVLSKVGFAQVMGASEAPAEAPAEPEFQANEDLDSEDFGDESEAPAEEAPAEDDVAEPEELDEEEADTLEAEETASEDVEEPAEVAEEPVQEETPAEEPAEEPEAPAEEAPEEPASEEKKDE